MLQQIEHLRDHGTLPDRVDYSKDDEEAKADETSNQGFRKCESNDAIIETTGSTSLESEIGGRPSDPTTSDLPKEGTSETQNKGIQEDTNK